MPPRAAATAPPPPAAPAAHALHAALRGDAALRGALHQSLAV